MTLFELDWLGGEVERAFRRSAGEVDDLPWGTLDPGDYPPHVVVAARRSWTEGTYTEYRTAAAFTALLQAMLQARAPVDLIGMAGSFVADEMLHVELNARVAMELGGGAPYLVDMDRLLPTSHAREPLERALELAIQICCVGETLSVPLLVGAARSATHPLTRAVLGRLARDERPHAELGWLLLAWAQPRLDDAARVRLSHIARAALASSLPDSTSAPELSADEQTAVAALGWMDHAAHAELVGRVVHEQIVAPLAEHGISAR